MNKYLLAFVILLTFFVGYFLRTYKIDTNYYFSGELGKELLYTRSFALQKTLPLTGMPTSHEWLSYGPLYYWLLIPIFNIFNGDPYILFWISLVASLVALLLNYSVVDKIFNYKVAIISTFIQAISPLFIWQTRLSKLHVFFWILVPLYIYFLNKLWNGEKKFVFITGIIFGIMFSFHFSQVPWIIISVALFWIKKQKYKFPDIFMYAVGVVLPNITLLWQDKGLLVWLPYRVVSSAGRNLSETITSFNEFFGKIFFWNESYWTLVSLLFVISFVHFLYTNRDKIVSDFKIFILASTILTTLFATFMHGSPPVHYFLPIFTVLPIFFAFCIQNKVNLTFVLLPVFMLNLSSFNDSVLFYKQTSSMDSRIDYVPISVQKAVSLFVVNDANSKEFSIKRVGPYDYFPENYSQNYKYLVLYFKGNLVESSNNVYTIVEEQKTGRVYVQK